MKKILSIVCALFALATVVSAQLVEHDWYSIDDLGRLDDPYTLENLTGRAAPANAVLAVYRATEARDNTTTWHNDIVVNKDLTIGAGTGDQLHFVFNCEKVGVTYFYSPIFLNPGDSYYTVVFSRSYIADIAAGSSTKYIVLDRQTYQAKTGGNVNYEVFEKSKCNGIAWQDVVNATNGHGVAAVTDFSFGTNDVSLAWHGGFDKTRYLECTDNLGTNAPTWSILLTNNALTSVYGNYSTNSAPTNSAMFYRVRTLP
ncbi:hypothetical protein [Pontiella sulfatireligans]|uniref:Uncharacterized protein n=1 Tax=Pontiella sulfatireligans TaxID=2750658 RepID=A0A6C2UH21_9BACT|nr:hypothetical protein [Pontiella sulfatireligans]VGO18711.1 hypothetical protein SCARR_00764 [Pontiella sulfatireligans]